MRNSLALFLAFFLLLAALPQLASADGGIFIPPYGQYVYSPSQKAVIVWDGSNETMILSTRMTMQQPDSFAWVVPVPSSTKPEVTAGDIEVFYAISRLLSPDSRSQGGYFGGFGAATGSNEGSVQVVEEKKVDVYDIAILRATDASVLANWLNENNYSVPSGADSILKYYVDKGDFYFIANRIDISNVYGDLAITGNDSKCADAMLSYGRDSVYIESQQDTFVNDTLSGERYAPDEVKILCEGASVDAVNILYKLRNGVSTPLKITFSPGKPFYPMRMTSLNNGSVLADVYIFADAYMADASGLMGIGGMTPANDALKEQLNLTAEEYLTSLEFDGDSSGLTEDSTFAATQYDPSKDPHYVSPEEGVAGAALVLLAIPMLVILFWPITLLPIALGGIAGYLLRGKKKGKRPAWFLAISLAVLIIAETLLAMFSFGFFWFDLSALTMAVVVAAMTIPAFVSTNLKWKPWKRAVAVIIPIIAFSLAFVMMPFIA